jgi:hypothetical protein
MLRQFAALCLVVFLGMAVWHGFVRHHTTTAIVCAILGLVLGPIGLVRPQALRLIFVGWMYVAFPIGWVVSHVVLGALFYGLFTPVGLIFRLMGRDPLTLRRPQAAASYWAPKPRVTDKRRYFSQF